MSCDCTIVTASLNPGSTLKDCLTSVAAQRGMKTEHIVVDGGSVDGTIDLLKSYQKKLPSLQWISEPDRGIADAMNKGASMAAGRWLYFLQADDRILNENSLQKVISLAVSNNPNLLAAGVQLGPRKLLPEKKGQTGLGWPLCTRFKMPFRHQGLVISREAWELTGEYDKQFRITMDFDWMLRAYILNLTVMRAGFALAYVGDGGVSSAKSGGLYRERLFEENKTRLKNANGVFWVLLYKLFWMLYRPYKLFSTRYSSR